MFFKTLAGQFEKGYYTCCCSAGGGCVEFNREVVDMPTKGPLSKGQGPLWAGRFEKGYYTCC